jgi:hypothetical protein
VTVFALLTALVTLYVFIKWAILCSYRATDNEAREGEWMFVGITGGLAIIIAGGFAVFVILVKRGVMH